MIAFDRVSDEALLTDEEYAIPEKKWPKLFKDPFPKWKMGIQGW